MRYVGFALASTVAIAALLAKSSPFTGVDDSQASTIRGGACYDLIVFGCQRVVSFDGHTYKLSGAGCNDSIAGTKTILRNCFSSPRGKFTWCSTDQSWDCGAAITSRYWCDSAGNGEGEGEDM